MLALLIRLEICSLISFKPPPCISHPPVLFHLAWDDLGPPSLFVSFSLAGWCCGLRSLSFLPRRRLSFIDVCWERAECWVELFVIFWPGHLLGTWRSSAAAAFANPICPESRRPGRAPIRRRPGDAVESKTASERLTCLLSATSWVNLEIRRQIPLLQDPPLLSPPRAPLASARDGSCTLRCNHTLPGCVRHVRTRLLPVVIYRLDALGPWKAPRRSRLPAVLCNHAVLPVSAHPTSESPAGGRTTSRDGRLLQRPRIVARVWTSATPNRLRASNRWFRSPRPTRGADRLCLAVSQHRV